MSVRRPSEGHAAQRTSRGIERRIVDAREYGLERVLLRAEHIVLSDEIVQPGIAHHLEDLLLEAAEYDVDAGVPQALHQVAHDFLSRRIELIDGVAHDQ